MTRSSIAFFALLVSLISASAQPNPSTVKMIVPYSPGGIGDVAARIVVDQIAHLGPPTVIIENRPGAGTIIGVEAAARAPADGSNILLAGAAFLINPLIRKVKYDPFKDFKPICYLLASPQLIVVNSKSPYRTLDDLIADAQAKPGELTLGANGPASPQQVAVESFKAAFKADMIFVPFSGGGPAVNAILGGHVTALVGNLTGVQPLIQAGSLRALATTAAKRISTFPEIPTLEEIGRAHHIEIESVGGEWIGFLAPAKTSSDSMKFLTNTFSRAFEQPDLREKLLSQQIFPDGGCGAQFGDFLTKQSNAMARAIKASAIGGQ